MGKWLAAGGVVLLALVILLWYEMQSSGAIAAPTTNTKPVAQAEAEPQHPAPVAHAIAAAAVTTEQPGKIVYLVCKLEEKYGGRGIFPRSISVRSLKGQRNKLRRMKCLVQRQQN